MSKFNKAVVTAGALLALGAIAWASDASEIIMKPGQGYLVGSDGRVSVVNLKMDDAMMARAQDVQHGTALFMHDGKVKMLFDRSLIGLMSR